MDSMTFTLCCALASGPFRRPKPMGCFMGVSSRLQLGSPPHIPGSTPGPSSVELDIDFGGTGFDVYFSHEAVKYLSTEGSEAVDIIASYIPPPVGPVVAGVLSIFVTALVVADAAGGNQGATLKNWGGVLGPVAYSVVPHKDL